MLCFYVGVNESRGWLCTTLPVLKWFQNRLFVHLDGQEGWDHPLCREGKGEILIIWPGLFVQQVMKGVLSSWGVALILQAGFQGWNSSSPGDGQWLWGRWLGGCLEPICRNTEEQSRACPNPPWRALLAAWAPAPSAVRRDCLRWGPVWPTESCHWAPCQHLGFLTPQYIHDGCNPMRSDWLWYRGANQSVGRRGGDNGMCRVYILSRSLLFLNREELLWWVSCHFFWYIFLLLRWQISMLELGCAAPQSRTHASRSHPWSRYL